MDGAILLACIAAMARIGIAALLATAALAKLRRRDDFAAAVAGYRLLPDAAVRPVALALPPAELAIAALLVLNLPAGMLAGAALLLLFAAAMAINLLRGRRTLDCGCDPTARPKPIAWTLVARNGALAGLLAPGLAALPPLPLPLLAAAGGAGLLAFLLSHILSLLGSFAPARDARHASGAR